MTKTPQFDKALDEILKNLKPHTRTCQQCGKDFDIVSSDINFYHMLRVPSPQECPQCRMRKRMAMMANILQFYKKECAAHKGEKVISQMDDATPYKIYDNNYWWNVDVWDGITYGRTYDPSRPFIKQLVDLLRNVPHMALARYNKKIINSEYTVGSLDLKNCYLSATIGIAENVNYGVWVVNSRDSFDVLRVDHIENCYDVIDCSRCYNSQHIQNSTNCLDSYFLFDCHNCQKCFGCINLRNKKYCFFNEQLAQRAYESKLAAIDLGSRKVRQEYLKKFKDFLYQRGVFRAVYTRNSSSSVGDHLRDCKNCFGVFNAMSVKFLLTFYKNENVRWSQDIIGATDDMDVTIFGPGELCYNVIEGLSVNKVIASYFIGDSMGIEYSFECFDCRYCFGCSGLKKKKYCILNKQYTENEYWKLVDEIKTRMLEEGIYGEFLPLEHSLFYYHDTYAQAMMPLNKESAVSLGARWREKQTLSEISNIQKLTAGEVPDHIKDVTDDILNVAIVCSETRKPFQITKKELEFYRHYSIPLPVKHSQTRLMHRFAKKNPYQLWIQNCTKCKKQTQTTYNPNGLAKNILCKACYLKEVI
ncbi:hypothetical protein MYX07_03570 [Patescibacteria group bacterium AH-259-L07]|nr:hypothetical protein [Patescibacteria group bacterium AH-259-L07]